MSWEPLHRSRPSHRWTNGDLAASVGADLGLPPDDEQKWLLDTIFAEKAADAPASFEVCTVAPRQNIKTSTYGIAALADLFVFGVQRHVWSAHLLDTAKATFRDFRDWIGSNAEYADLVDFYEGHQDLAIFRRDTGASIDFRSRTGKAGRGLTGVKRITLDEALYLEPKHVGAVYPTMLTQPGAQVRIASSAGLVTSDQLRRLRDRGRAGKDGRLGYVEYGAVKRRCADRDCRHVVGRPGCALDDRELWWQANCALWPGRITEAAIADQRGSVPPDEFAREFLSWWDDPVSLGGALDVDRWRALADPHAGRGTVLAFGVDMDEDRTLSIGIAWEREDRGTQVMLGVDPDQRVDVGLTAAAAVDRLEHLAGEYGGTVVLGGPAVEALEEQLAARGVETVTATGPQFAGGCGLIADGLRDGTLHHGNQEDLNRSVGVARWRAVGTSGDKAWQLKDAPGISPLAATTRAVYGLSTAGGVLVW